MSVSAAGAKLPLELQGCPFSAYIYIHEEKGGGADGGGCEVEVRGCHDDPSRSHFQFCSVVYDRFSVL